MTSGVTIHGQGDLLGQLIEQCGVNIGQRGTHWRNHILKAVLMGHNHINIAFDHNHLIASPHTLTALVQTIQQRTFIKQQRLWRVEILGIAAWRQQGNSNRQASSSRPPA